MILSDLVAIAISFVLAMLISWGLLLPFFRNELESLGIDPAEQLRNEAAAKKELTFSSLEELERDYRSGKLSEEEYAANRAELMKEASLTLEQLKELDN